MQNAGFLMTRLKIKIKDQFLYRAMKTYIGGNTVLNELAIDTHVWLICAFVVPSGLKEVFSCQGSYQMHH